MKLALSSGVLLTMLVTVVAGTSLGILFSALAVQIGWLGNLFLDSVMMFIIPLIISSIISGIGSVQGLRDLPRIGSAAAGDLWLRSLRRAWRVSR